jgi:hypothetical protein
MAAAIIAADKTCTSWDRISNHGTINSMNISLQEIDEVLNVLSDTASRFYPGMKFLLELNYEERYELYVRYARRRHILLVKNYYDTELNIKNYMIRYLFKFLKLPAASSGNELAVKLAVMNLTEIKNCFFVLG